MDCYSRVLVIATYCNKLLKKFEFDTLDRDGFFGGSVAKISF